MTLEGNSALSETHREECSCSDFWTCFPDVLPPSDCRDAYTLVAAVAVGGGEGRGGRRRGLGLGGEGRGGREEEEREGEGEGGRR